MDNKKIFTSSSYLIIYTLHGYEASNYASPIHSVKKTESCRMPLKLFIYIYKICRR